MRRIFYYIATIAAIVVTYSCHRVEDVRYRHVSVKDRILSEQSPASLERDISLDIPVKGVSKETVRAISDFIFTSASVHRSNDPEIDPKAILKTFTEELGESSLSLAGTIYSSFSDIICYCVKGKGGEDVPIEEYANIRKDSGRVLGSGDIFKDPDDPALKEKIGAGLKRTLKAEDYALIFDGSVNVSDNFRMDTNGISLVYAEYGMAPYFLDTIYLDFTWDELKEFLR